MNKCFLWLVVWCGLATPLLAQDKAASGKDKASAKSTARPGGTNAVLEIFSDNFEYDSANGRAVYTGHVHVDDAEMTIDCELLTVTFARSNVQPSAGSDATGKPGDLSAVAGGKIDTIIAERKVVIVNRKDGMRATGAKAVYMASTDVVELTGNPVVEQPQGTLEADVVILDRAKSRLLAKGREGKQAHMQLRPDAMKREQALKPKPGVSKPQP